MDRFLDGIGNIGDTFFDVGMIADAMPDLIKIGLVNTLQLTVVSGLIGIFLGIVVALGLMSSNRASRLPCRVFVDVFRGLPHILVVYVIGQGLPIAGINIFGSSSFGYAALAIGIMESAYMAEIFRSGFQGVDRSIIEASRSSGVSHLQTLRGLVIPIGTVQMLPALTGQFILIIKGTSLVYVLGLVARERDLFALAQNIAINNANLSPLVGAGLLYLLITVPMTYAVSSWERRLAKGPTKPVPAMTGAES